MFDLSKSEMEIMSVLWAADKPLSRAEILERSTQKSWKESSIHILLNSMLKKQAITVNGFTKTGSHYGRTFVPTMTEAQYASAQIQQMQSYKKSKKNMVMNVFSALLDEAELNEDTIQELERLLEEKKTRKKK